MKKINDFLKIFCTYTIVLLPVLGTYGFLSRSITFADIFIIIALICILIKCLMKRSFKISSNAFFLFCIWGVFSTLIATIINSITFSGVTILQTIKFIIYSLAILLIPNNYFDVELAQKIYTRIVVFLSLIVFIQYLIFIVTGNFYPWIINSKYFPAIYVNDDYFSSAYLYMLGGNFSYRPSSLFSEPALFAQYVSPCLVLNMFKNESRKKYLVLIMITIATFLGKSANGIVYIISIWNVYLFIKFFKVLKSKKIKSIVVLVTMLLLLISPVIVPKIKSVIMGDKEYSLINRITEINDVSGKSSGSMRVTRGWKIYDGLSIDEKFLGIGIGNIVNYLNLHPDIVFMFSKSYNGYMSGLSAIFVNTGLIGGLLFLYWGVKQFIIKNNIVKCLLIFLGIYLIASNSFFSAQFVLTSVLIMAYEKSLKEK